MVVGNPRASEKNIPFLEKDLNRIFPGHEHGTYEEVQAYKLSEKIKEADIVLDIHSTKTTDLGNNSMVIVTTLNNETKEILKVIQPPKVLHMLYNASGALIFQAKVGIAFEYGLDDINDVLQATIHDIAEILLYLGIIEKNPYSNPRVLQSTELFEVYDVCPKSFIEGYTLNDTLKNFTLVEKDMTVCKTDEGTEINASEDFYPILFGNNRYTEILGFKARKIESL